MSSNLFDFIILIIAGIMSAFFSGTESALFSLKKSDLHRYSQSQSRTERSIYHTMLEPEKILITILLGNLFSNLIATAIMTRLTLTFWSSYGHFISIAIVTPIIIILCEISPKIIAINAYEVISRKIYPFIMAVHQILFPFRIILIFLTNLLIRILKIDFNKDKVTEDELDYAVHIGAIEGTIQKEEGDFIKNVMVFSKKEAANIMFPRNRALFIPLGTSIREAMDLCLDAGVIRAPVYQKDLDHVVGFIDSRELMPYILGYKKGRNINKFIHRIRFFPATRDLTELLRDFLSEGIQIAVVVDEYGGTAGVVTLNSILAELMGKDFKKWEIDYRPEVRRIDENLSIINGDMQIHDFNLHYEENLASENSDTVGGFFIERVNRIPKRGDEIEINNHILRIKYIIKNRIESIEVARKNK